MILSRSHQAAAPASDGGPWRWLRWGWPGSYRASRGTPGCAARGKPLLAPCGWLSFLSEAWMYLQGCSREWGSSPGHYTAQSLWENTNTDVTFLYFEKVLKLYFNARVWSAFLFFTSFVPVISYLLLISTSSPSVHQHAVIRMYLLTAEIAELCLSWCGVSLHLAHMLFFLSLFFGVLMIDSSDNIHTQHRILVQVKTKGSTNWTIKGIHKEALLTCGMAGSNIDWIWHRIFGSWNEDKKVS